MVVHNPVPQIDNELLDFIHHRVNSFIKWDLIRFFHDNPHTKDTAENIATHVQRDVGTTRQELTSLVEASVLVSEMIGDHVIFSLVGNLQTRKLITTFMEACNDRKFRVVAIHHVITGMQLHASQDFRP